MINKNVSIILPTYNESEIILKAIDRVINSTDEYLLELIIVDDNSPDKTWELVKNYKDPRIRLLRRKNEKGLASALADGINIAKGDIIVWLDCDLGIAPELINELIKNLDTNDVIIGSRYVKNGKDLRPKFRFYLSLILNIFAQILLGTKYKDYTSGFALIKKSILEDIKISRKGFGEYFIEFLFDCKQKKLKIKEVGYVYQQREVGFSKSGDSLYEILSIGKYYVFKIIVLFFRRIKEYFKIKIYTILLIFKILFIKRLYSEVKKGSILIGFKELFLTLYFLTFSFFYINTRNKKKFLFLNNKFNYFCHYYNLTFTNERAVELSIIKFFLKKYRNANILEVGNVLNNYQECDHLVIDKYEKFYRVKNIDIVDFHSNKKFDLIFSISTIEHIGFDEPVVENEKFIRALSIIRNHLKKNGLCLITIPVGYNQYLDKYLREESLFDYQYYFIKLDKQNTWKQSNKLETFEKKFNYPFRFANALVIGVIGKLNS